MLDQQRRALAKQQASLQEEAVRVETAGKNITQQCAQREQALQAQEKALQEQVAQLNAARQKLEAEQAQARQALEREKAESEARGSAPRRRRRR